jgi:hypothetical protein
MLGTSRTNLFSKYYGMPSQNIYVGASRLLPIKIFSMMSLKTQDRQ